MAMDSDDKLQMTQGTSSEIDDSFVDFDGGEDAGEPMTKMYWATDEGRLDFDTRRCLLSLLRGPYLDARREPEMWKALIAHEEEIRIRLSDLFLDLIVDDEALVAFVRNPETVEIELPKAVRSQPLTILDTVMVLSLRRELLSDTDERVFVSRDDLFGQLATYRSVTKLDEAGFRKKLEASWNKLIKNGILHRMQGEDRCEISPVLPLVFGVSECQSVEAAFERLLEEGSDGECGGDDEEDDDDES